jgi:hypothetical protein
MLAPNKKTPPAPPSLSTPTVAVSVTEKKTVKSSQSLLNFIKKKQEDHRFIKSIEVGCTFMLISILSVFAIRPAVITITQLSGEIKAKKLLHEKIDSKLRQVIKAQNNFAEVQDYYGAIQKAFPNHNSAQREFIKSGTTPAEWDKMFKEVD